jgi:hypothetical protein
MPVQSCMGAAQVHGCMFLCTAIRNKTDSAVREWLPAFPLPVAPLHSTHPVSMLDCRCFHVPTLSAVYTDHRRLTCEWELWRLQWADSGAITALGTKWLSCGTLAR